MQIEVAERIPVPFEGKGGGLGELSWAQQSMWAEMHRAGKTLTMGGDRRLAPDADVTEFVDEFRFYLSRFQAMRTLLRFEPGGRILQLVEESGLAEIEVYDAGERDADGVAAEVARHLARTFDYEREWPIRMALVRQDGVLTHQLVTLAHHAADSTSAMAMFEDMRDRDPLTGEPPRPPGIQPLAQAELQQTPSSRRHNDAALAYWEEQLRVIPPTLFTAPPAEEEGCWEVDFTAPALYLGMHATAARLGVGTRPVLYAAFVTAMARITGVNPVSTMITVNNRFRPGLANAGGHMIQHGLCTLDTDVPFDELVVTAKRKLLKTQKNAYYAQTELDELIERVGRERGVSFDLFCLFNDRRLDDSPLKTPPAGTPPATARWQPLPGLHQRLMFHVNESPDALASLVQIDTAYFSRASVDALFEHMETLLR